MRLTEHIFVVGSGEADWSPTDPLDSQVYLVTGDEGHVLIDAGAGRSHEAILGAVRADGIEPAGIRWALLTHGHGDHAGGAAGWRRALPGIRVAASGEVAAWLATADETATSVDRARSAGIYPPDYRLAACDADLVLDDGTVVIVGAIELTAVATPGHARGHMAFVAELDGARTVFSGDAVFPGGRILLQDTWDCDLRATLRSVERLAALSPRRLLAGHLGPVLDGAPEHLAAATERIERLLVPESLL